MKKAFSALFITLFFCALIFGLHYGIYALLVRQGDLRLKEIVVKGNHFLKDTEVIEKSGLKAGTGVFDFSLSDVSAALQSHFLIEKAKVSLLLPDKVEIEVAEKKPVLSLALGNDYFVCSKEAVLLAKGINENVPLIKADFEWTTSGNRIQDRYFQLLAMRLSDFSQLDRIKQIYVKKQEGIYLILKELSLPIFFLGKSVPENNDLEKVIEIAKKIKKEGLEIQYVDVRKENAIGYKELNR
jgi:cell division septal protein FtsQ